MAKVTGVDRVTRRLQRLGPDVEKFIGAALHAAGDEIKAEAQHLITQGSVSGKGHKPSKPGEPPMNDTGHLKNNIEVTQPDPLRVRITSNAKYSAALEYGSAKMAARPFMAPAARAKKKRAKDLVAKAVNTALKKG